jgi:hypothetical protein
MIKPNELPLRTVSWIACYNSLRNENPRKPSLLSGIGTEMLNVNVYFDRTFNDPLVSNSFIRATTAGGVQVRFNLAE